MYRSAGQGQDEYLVRLSARARFGKFDVKSKSKSIDVEQGGWPRDAGRMSGCGGVSGGPCGSPRTLDPED